MTLKEIKQRLEAKGFERYGGHLTCSHQWGCPDRAEFVYWYSDGPFSYFICRYHAKIALEKELEKGVKHDKKQSPTTAPRCT